MSAKFEKFDVNYSIENELDSILESLFNLLDKKWQVASGILPGSLSDIDAQQNEIRIQLNSIEPHASHILIKRIEKENYESKIHEKARHGMTTIIGKSDGIANVNYLKEWWNNEYSK